MRILLGLRLCFGLLASTLWGGEDLPSRVQAEAVAFAEARVAAQPGSYVFRVLKVPILPPLKAGAVTLEASHLSKQDPSGRCFVAIKVLVDGRPAGMSRVDLEGLWKGELLRAKTSLPRKQALAEDLFDRVPFEGQLPGGAMTEVPEGMRLRQPLQAGKWLIRADMEAVPIVTAGERVRLTASWEALTVGTEATARSSGALGDSVRLELPTHKIITAKVTGTGEARLEFAK